MTKPYIIGICGGSGSGKTYLRNQLIEAFPSDQVSLLSLDDYYKDLEEQVKDEEGLVNFDHPDSLKMDEFVNDVAKLRRGESFERAEFMFNLEPGSGELRRFEPSPIIILEGILIFHPDEIQPLIDLKIFVEANESVRLCRRIKRDQEERGYALEYILHNYEKYVVPMYQEFILPTKEKCDIVINNYEGIEASLQMLIGFLRQQLLEQKKSPSGLREGE